MGGVESYIQKLRSTSHVAPTLCGTDKQKHTLNGNKQALRSKSFFIILVESTHNFS